MGLKEQAYSVLVVSSAEKFNMAMADMLPESGLTAVAYAKSVSAAQREIAERSFDFVIINAPLCDDPGIHFATDCSMSRGAVVLLLIKNEICSEVDERVSPCGVFTLGKPMSKPLMVTALSWLKAAKALKSGYEKKTTSIEDKMKEIRLVNKAKWQLISRENMTEPEAHRYLEKEAMDRCITKAELAKEILEQE